MIKEELKLFCSNEDWRWNLMEPYSEGEYSFATDGWTIIRIPRLQDVPESEDAPKASGLFSDTLAAPEYFPIPVLPDRIIKTCPDCKGKGIYRELGEEYPCENCLEHEDDERGSGKVEELIKIEIGPCLFNRNFLERLQSLPNVQIGPTGVNKQAWIKFDGGDGLIMPIRR